MRQLNLLVNSCYNFIEPVKHCRNFLYILLTFISFNGVSQQRIIDSIQSLPSGKNVPDSIKIDRMIAIAQSFQNIRFDSCIYYSEGAVQLAEKSGYQKGIADANKQMAIVHFLNSDTKKARECNSKAMMIYNRIHDYKGIGAIINNLGVMNENRGEYEKALKYYKISVSYRKRAGDIKGLGGSFNNIGNVYSDMGQHAEALRYLFRSLMMREMNHEVEGTAKVLGNIAGNYFAMNNFKEAKVYAMRGLKIFRERGIPDGEFQTLTVLGGINLKENNIGEAWRNYHAAYKIALDMGIEGNVAVAFTNLGRLSILQNNLQDAGSYLLQALAYSEKVEDKMGISICLNALGEIALKERNYKEAIHFLQKGVAISKSISNLDEIRNGTDLLSKVYENTGDTKLALKMLQESIVYKDSLNKDEAGLRMQDASFKYELKKKENQILHLSSERDKLEYEDKIQRNSVIAMGVLLVFAIIIVILLYSTSRKEKMAMEAIRAHQLKIEKQSANLEELNKVKDKIFTVLAHDLRSPLAALLSLLELLERKEISPEEFISIQQSLGTGTRSLSLLLDNLLNWSRSQIKGSPVAKKKQIEIKNLLEQVKLVYQQVCALKNVQIEIECEAGLTLKADPDHMDIVIRNLVSNAIKFSNSDSRVFIRAYRKNSEICIEVEDQGKGISMDRISSLLQYIPVQSERGTAGETGTGIGLVLCNEFTTINDGKIEIKSEVGKGSIFSLIFPL